VHVLLVAATVAAALHAEKEPETYIFSLTPKRKQQLGKKHAKSDKMLG